MANTDTAKGFDPTGVMYGLGRYQCDAGLGTAIFRNDLMEMEDDGMVRIAEAANTQLVGSIQGTTAATTAQKALVAASTAATLLIADNPDQKYIAQDDGDTDTSAQTYIGMNAELIAGAGSTTTGLSGHEIDIDTKNASAAQIRLLDLLRAPDNAFGANADFVCVINEHFLKTTSGV